MPLSLPTLCSPCGFDETWLKAYFCSSPSASAPASARARVRRERGASSRKRPGAAPSSLAALFWARALQLHAVQASFVAPPPQLHGRPQAASGDTQHRHEVVVLPFAPQAPVAVKDATRR